MGKTKKIDLEKLKELYNKGLSDREMANNLGCSRKVVERRRTKLGLLPNCRQSPIWKHVDEIRRLFAEGKSGAEICNLFNVSSTTLAKLKQKRNIRSNYEMKLTKADVEKALELAKNGLMDPEIAKQLNVSRGSILRLRKINNIKSSFSYDKISKIHKEKFEELFYQGLDDKEIAAALGVSIDGVYGYRMRHNYNRKDNREAQDIPLTQDNIEIILGIMMGDGSMERMCKNTRLSIAHCPSQREYCDYIANKLSNLKPTLYSYISKPHPKTGKQYQSYWLTLATNPSLNTIHKHFYNNGKKRIPIELFDNFTWQSLAYLFMDDGSHGKSGGFIATNCFTMNELQDFQKFLLDKFTLKTTICKSHVLYIKAKSFCYMKSKIEPYMCECMKYKIK